MKVLFKRFMESELYDEFDDGVFREVLRSFVLK